MLDRLREFEGADQVVLNGAPEQKLIERLHDALKRIFSRLLG